MEAGALKQDQGRKKRRREQLVFTFLLCAVGIISVSVSYFGSQKSGTAVKSNMVVSSPKPSSPVSSAASLASALPVSSLPVSSKAPAPVSSEPLKLAAKKIITVPYISQEGSYATGCELVSATMFLNYYHYNVSVKDVVGKTPCSELRQADNGSLTGKNPAQSFIGDPTSEDGFGCYAPVVVNVLNSFFQQNNREKASDITGTDFANLLPYLSRDDPVMVWATINMLPSYAGANWIQEDTGQTFTWPAQEHCLVLVGYDDSKYYFNDPYDSNGMVGYDRKLVEQRYQELGKQAVVAVKC